MYRCQSDRSTTFGDSVLRLSENLSMSSCAGERDLAATSSRAVYCSWSVLPSRGPACHRARCQVMWRSELGSSYLTEGRDKGPEVVGAFSVQELGSLMTAACSIYCFHSSVNCAVVNFPSEYSTSRSRGVFAHLALRLVTMGFLFFCPEAKTTSARVRRTCRTYFTPHHTKEYAHKGSTLHVLTVQPNSFHPVSKQEFFI